MTAPSCRHCGAALTVSVVDLGSTPLANDYIEPGSDLEQESHELHARLCTVCNLVQVSQAVTPERLFSDYAYFSSYSETWLAHARRYANDATARFGLSTGDLVVEIASNDGYLLQNFVTADIDVLGIEPAANVAKVAVERGVPTEVEFFGEKLARSLRERGHSPRLIVGNNVFAHVPDINDFAAGLATLAGESGIVSLEFPHLGEMIRETQFDTIYHEHFSYLSLVATENILGAAGLTVFDVEQLPTHGGSLRVFAAAAGQQPIASSVAELRQSERAEGLDDPATYRAFSERAERIRRDFVEFLDGAVESDATVAAYGAAAKGNTLLNYCGTTSAHIAMVADASPHKQGRLLPGSRVPIGSPEQLLALRPDYVVILPWNLRSEITAQLSEIRSWGGRFVMAVPELTIET